MADSDLSSGCDDIEVVVEHEFGFAVAADQDHGLDVGERLAQRRHVGVVRGAGLD